MKMGLGKYSSYEANKVFGFSVLSLDELRGGYSYHHRQLCQSSLLEIDIKKHSFSFTGHEKVFSRIGIYSPYFHVVYNLVEGTEIKNIT